MHSDYGAFICIIVHLQCVAFYMSCIQMHLYASPHKVHSVDTLHSDALAFLRIQVGAIVSTRRAPPSSLHAPRALPSSPPRLVRVRNPQRLCKQLDAYQREHRLLGYAGDPLRLRSSGGVLPVPE